MTAIIWAFIRSHWLGVIVGLLIAGGLAYCEGQHLEIVHLKDKIVTLQQDNETLTTNNQTLTGAINSQNTAILALQKVAREKQEKAAADLLLARKEAQKNAGQIAALRAQKMTKNDCDNMKAAIDIYFSRLIK